MVDRFEQVSATNAVHSTPVGWLLVEIIDPDFMALQAVNRNGRTSFGYSCLPKVKSHGACAF